MSSSIRIGDWVVEPRRNVLSHPGAESEAFSPEDIRIEPRAMEVLVYLAERPKEVISKGELIQAVWQGAFVTDEALTNCISNLRKSLGDDARNPHYIETIPQKGYRLLASVSVVEPSSSSGAHRSFGSGKDLFAASGTSFRVATGLARGALPAWGSAFRAVGPGLGPGARGGHGSHPSALSIRRDGGGP